MGVAKPPNSADLVGMATVVDDAGEHEERAGGDAVIQHLVDGAVGPGLSETKNTENDESEVAD